MIKKHVRKSQDHPSGGIIEREGPIHISNVKLVERLAAAKAKATKSGATKPTKPTKKKK
jgi:large subunit ribosomal protein L24